MARSRNIYVLMGSSAPVMAFTVKHELVSYLKRRESIPPTFAVFRMKDGRGSVADHDVIPMMELLNA